MALVDMSVEDFMSKDWGEDSSQDENDAEKTNGNTKKTKTKKLKKKKKKGSQINVAKPNVNQETEDQHKKSEKLNDKSKSQSQHQNELNNLKQSDPEFYQFLQEEDASLLKFGDKKFDVDDEASSDESEEGVHKLPDTLEEVSEDSDLGVDSSDENDAAAQDDEDLYDEDGTEAVSKRRKELITVTEKMVASWKERLSGEQSSITALRQVMQAFHACLARIDALETPESTDKKAKRKKKSTEQRLKYKVVGSSVFNDIIALCVGHVTPSLAKILNYFPEKMKQTKKKKAPLPNSCNKWATVRDMLRSYLHHVVLLAQSLLEPSVNRVVMRHLLLLLPYFISFPRISKQLLKFLLRCWSSDDNESVRVLSFLCISRLLKLEKDRFLENTMKQAYLGYVANCKFSSPSTLPMINFMQRTFAEICAVDADQTYRFAFLYIRQLAVHLRKAITTQNKETRQAVYNWQFIHSIALWCRVLSVLHPNDTLQPLIYPLVQIALGVIDLVPTARFYPLRFQLVRSLIALSDCTNTYIPLVPSIVCPLRLQDFRKKQSGVTVRPIPFETILKLSNSQLKEKAYRDTTMDHVYDLLMTFFNAHAHSIAFPELAVPAIVLVKKFVKDCKTANYCKIMKQVVDKVQANADFITKKRLDVSFQVKDIEAVQNWETELRGSGVPFHKVFAQYKRDRQRELAQQIADKDRNVDEKLPSIDRAKFFKMTKDADKEEFSQLFQDGSDEEEIKADFEKAIEHGPSKKRKIVPESKPAPANEDDDISEEEEPVPSPKKRKEAPKKKRPGKKQQKDSPQNSDGDADLVEDFHFSDSDD